MNRIRRDARLLLRADRMPPSLSGRPRHLVLEMVAGATHGKFPSQQGILQGKFLFSDEKSWRRRPAMEFSSVLSDA
jgi:hypothetical protein